LPWAIKTFLSRGKIHVLPVGDEEPVCDHTSQFDAKKAVRKKKKETPLKKSVDDFCNMDEDNITTASIYNMKWDKTQKRT
jgi:hypothetical protein